jgi:RimJ/RimL family protein N-acetyltransferase
MDPLMMEVPERIDTPNLVLRIPRRGDGAALNAAVAASMDELGPWIPWAGKMPTPEESEIHCRRQQAKFILREDFVFLIFARESDGGEGELFGGTGLHRIDWGLRRFEIGYWRKTGLEGRGIITETVQAMTRLAFDTLGARRVEIRMADDNVKSWKVAERAGYTHEALLRFDSVTPSGEPRSTRVYARVRGAEEPFEA